MQYLEDNEALIKTILDNINAGRVEEASNYQQRLQQNLMWLASIADAQPQPGHAAVRLHLTTPVNALSTSTSPHTTSES